MNELPFDKSCVPKEFGLIVTGKSEKSHIENLFRELSARGYCFFQSIHIIQQLSPITSRKRKQPSIVGTANSLPARDQELALRARRFLRKKSCRYVIVIDDLERKRVDQANDVYQHYRTALDNEKILSPQERQRSAVHFLVNMLEAYFFADPQAVNKALKPAILLQELDGDVEKIGNPKAVLKEHCKKYREIQDSGKVLNTISLTRVLENPECCKSLRTLVAWCIAALKPVLQEAEHAELIEQFKVRKESLSPLTSKQIDMVP